jgi:TPR repeat protein
VLSTEGMSVRVWSFVALLIAPACEKDKPSQPPETSAAPSGVDGLTAACDGGDAKACGELGSAYQFGREGVPENQPLAAAAFEKACNLEHAHSCGSLGWMHLNGKGVAKDANKGIALVEKACAGRDESSCFSLAAMFAEQVNMLMAGMIETASEEEAQARQQDATTRAAKLLAAGCALNHACSCLAAKTGECDSADACSAPMEGGECAITCAQEYGCSTQVFAILPGAGP